MLAGFLPFSDHDPEILYPKIKKANKILPDLIPGFLSEKVKDFLLQILNTNPEKRLKLRDIKRAPWIKRSKDIRIKCKSRNERRKTDTVQIRSLARATLEVEVGRQTKFESNKVSHLQTNLNGFFLDEHKNCDSTSDNTVITEDKVTRENSRIKGVQSKHKRKFLQSIDLGTCNKTKNINQNLLYLSPLNTSKVQNVNRSIQIVDVSVSERNEKDQTRCTSLDNKSGDKLQKEPQVKMFKGKRRVRPGIKIRMSQILARTGYNPTANFTFAAGIKGFKGIQRESFLL
mmetsp:Transcript_12658/g.14252  ORF Transcript_12658/g.14252 Transcript_12658/m.14252 type:complete len:287 (+) Transcript_12658:587-1447(+)